MPPPIRGGHNKFWTTICHIAYLTGFGTARTGRRKHGTPERVQSVEQFGVVGLRRWNAVERRRNTVFGRKLVARRSNRGSGISNRGSGIVVSHYRHLAAALRNVNNDNTTF